MSSHASCYIENMLILIKIVYIILYKIVYSTMKTNQNLRLSNNMIISRQ